VRLHVMRLPSASARSFQLEAAVHSLILAHAQRAGIDRSEAVGFFQTLRTNALRAAMQAGGGGADEILRPDQLMYIAVRLWTSAATLRGREFCSLLNQALREDGADTIDHAATCTHAINTFCVARRGGIPVPWPSEHVLYRGGAMPRCFQSFFAVGKAYRAPMFIATSVEQDVSIHTFLMRLPPATASQSPPFQEPVRWRFHLDGASTSIEHASAHHGALTLPLPTGALALPPRWLAAPEPPLRARQLHRPHRWHRARRGRVPLRAVLNLHRARLRVEFAAKRQRVHLAAALYRRQRRQRQPAAAARPAARAVVLTGYLPLAPWC